MLGLGIDYKRQKYNNIKSNQNRNIKKFRSLGAETGVFIIKIMKLSQRLVLVLLYKRLQPTFRSLTTKITYF